MENIDLNRYEKFYRNELLKLRDKKCWDNKEWHRAIGVEQSILEDIESGKVLLDAESFKMLKDLTEKSEQLNLLRFVEPKIIVSWIHKGGTGKSTLASNLAYELSRRGYNVLAIDTDSQADMTSVLYPDYLEAQKDMSFYDAFIMADDFQDYISKTNYDNLHVISGSAKSEDLEKTLSTLPVDKRSKIFSKCLKSIMNYNYYDFIIVDMDKSAGLLNRAILEKADYILTPLEASIFSLKALVTIKEQITIVNKTNPKLKMLGMFFNKVDLRKKGVAEARQIVEDMFPGCMLTNFLKAESNIENSQMEHMPLAVYAKTFGKYTKATKQFVKLTDEILQRIAMLLREEE